MNFALETFEGLYKDYKKIAILGDMLELGEESKKLHEAIYDKLINSDVNLILLYGNQMKYLYNKFNGNEKVFHFQDKQEIKEKIKSVSEPCAILLKGSRGMRLEETIEE
jgi:UDP-N-acetylmuramoyl-tripeptide--D-alanyl-D-alanine ligase